MSDFEVAQTIIDQMGGLGKLRAMVGATNFLASDNSVSFQFKGCRKAKKCIVTLLPSDTYQMQLGKLDPKTFDWVELYNEKGLYNDMLKPVFESQTGLYLSL